MSRKVASLKRLYEAGRLTQEQIRNTVDLGWITQAEYEEIVKQKEA